MNKKEIILKVTVVFFLIGAGSIWSENQMLGIIFNIIGCTALSFLTPSKENK